MNIHFGCQTSRGRWSPVSHSITPSLKYQRHRRLSMYLLFSFIFFGGGAGITTFCNTVCFHPSQDIYSSNTFLLCPGIALFDLCYPYNDGIQHRLIRGSAVFLTRLATEQSDAQPESRIYGRICNNLNPVRVLPVVLNCLCHTPLSFCFSSSSFSSSKRFLLNPLALYWFLPLAFFICVAS